MNGAVPFSSASERFAIVDAGTNTFLLLIAELFDKTLTIIEDAHRIARLGSRASASGSIGQEAIERVLQIALHYNKLCQQSDVSTLLLAGTAVFRTAQNGAEVFSRIAKIFQLSRVYTRILSSQEEAQLSYLGSTFPILQRSSAAALVIDIGGGSTELTWGHGLQPYLWSSTPIGAVKLWEMVQAQRLSLDEVLQHVSAQLALVTPPFHSPYYAIAVAGTPVTLAGIAYGIPYTRWWEAHLRTLHREQVQELLLSLWNMPLEARCSHPAIHPDRAEILPAGAAILWVIMELLNLPALTVSIYGLRYGLLLQLLQELKGVELEQLQLIDTRVSATAR
jgi:exopolyphosphatase/guanosine-5'-triphosphate,3'-diphosphate pyrophosphatase